jgi:NitT/TauT family transport system substrate-binding protein
VQRYKNQDTWATDPLPQGPTFIQLQKIMVTAGELKEQLPLEQLVVTKFAAKALETVKPDAEPKP